MNWFECYKCIMIYQSVMISNDSGPLFVLIQFIGFWRKLLVKQYDNKNQGFTRLVSQKNKHY
jgi:hypothetical protein